MVQDSELAAAVASLKGWASARVLSASSDSARASSGSATDSVSLVRGTAVESNGDDPSPFSMVRKVLRRGDDLPAWDRRHWRRELIAYRSGLLPSGEAGLTACRLLAAYEDSSGARLWLSPAPDEEDTQWSLGTFRNVAAQLAHWHARHLDDRLDLEWLVRDQLAQRISRTDAAGGLVEPDWNTPSVRRHFPPQLVGSLMALWHERHRALALREELDHTIAHGDFTRDNLYATGGSETVVIDWATLGTAPVGADLVELVISAFACLRPADHSSVVKTILGAYTDVLAERVDPGEIDLGFALTFGPVTASRLCWSLNRDPSEATAELWATVATEARHALDAVWAG